MAKREVAAITAALKATATSPVADTAMAVVLSPLPDAVNEMETEGAEAINEDVVLEDVTLVENDDSVMEILTVSLHILCIHGWLLTSVTRI